MVRLAGAAGRERLSKDFPARYPGRDRLGRAVEVPMRRTRVVGAVLLLAVGCLAAPAAEVGGVTFSETATAGGKDLVLNGVGLREKLWIDVYVAGLYLERKTSDSQEVLSSAQVKHLRMQFVYKKVTAKQLADAWSEGFSANAGPSSATLRPKLDELCSWMVDMGRGDEMAFTTVPGQGLEVQVRGQTKGRIAGDDFARAFWSIFLGDRPPTEKLKKGLLGAG
jgi:hypothetical protein